MKEQKSFKLSTLLVLTFMLTALFSISVFAEEVVVPSKVEGLKQTKATETTVSVEWDASLMSGVKYEVYLTDGLNIYPQGTTSSPSYYIGPLSGGKSYYVFVRAYVSVRNEETNQFENVYGEPSRILEVVTRPGYKTTITQTNATASAISLKWNPVAGADGYKIYITTSNLNSAKYLGMVRNAAATIQKLSASGSYTVYVFPVRINEDGFVAESNFGYSYAYGLKTLPAKINQLEITRYWENSKKVVAEWTEVNADGYEIQLYTYNGKKPVKKFTSRSNYVYLTNVKQTSFYKFRVRPYVMIGVTKKYGSWSAYKEFAQPVKFSAKSGALKSKSISVKWTKMKGAKNYTIYMSTNEKGGYKKVTTTKKTSYKVKKFKKKALKYNKNYYFYVVANKKSGKKTIKSPFVNYIRYRITKTYTFR